MVDAALVAGTIPLSLAQCRQVVDLYAQFDQCNALATAMAKPEVVANVTVTINSPSYVGGASYTTATTKVNVLAAIKAEADTTRAAVVKQLTALGYKV